jgi:TonB family protein
VHRILIVILISVAAAGCASRNHQAGDTYRLPHTMEELPYETAINAMARMIESEKTRKRLGLDARLRVLAIELPAMPQDAIDRYVEGSVFVKFTITQAGTVESVEVVSSPDQALSESTLKAIQAWRFSPATRGGEIVSVKADIQFAFQLPD